MSAHPPTWQRITLHANERIEALRSSLEVAKPDMIPALQAEVRVWRQVLDLPNMLSFEQIESSSGGYA